MNRENKRKKYEKHYYQSHACNEIFTCKVCGREIIPYGAGSGHRNHCPNCLSSLHVEEGTQKRRVGDHSPLPPVRYAALKPGGRRRQPDEADVDCAEALNAAALPY